MEERSRERRALEQDLRRALGRGELALRYQPVFACGSGEIVGFEALLRWTHPVRGPVPPEDFIAVAEESGLIQPLGRWVLEQACAAAASWPDGVRVAVNLSPAQFRSGDLPGLVAATLQGAGLPAGRLELEVTEGMLISDTDQTLTIMEALKALGVQLALDDFGTGYSSMGYLRRFPFDRVKVDRSFVGAVGSDEQAGAIVGAILAMARSLGMRSTAEGVEKREQLDFLRRYGCDEVQGFLLSRPVAAERIPSLLAEGAHGREPEHSRPAD
jgi:EAL domain-containing protein (putative c-di-GMP-specific phosphodiesterase class I)